MISHLAPEVRGSRLQGKPLGVVLAAAVVSVALGSRVLASPQFALEPWQGGPKPAWTLDVLDGEKLTLEGYLGKPVIVHFFATWCEPCVEELGSLERLTNRKYSGLAILAIDVGEIDARVRNFLRKHPVSFPVLLDRDRAVTKTWQVTALPTSFVLACGLTPVLHVRGDIAWDSAEVATSLDQAILKPAEGQPACNQQREESE